MDFKKILEPYQEKDVDRSYEAYIKWLTGPKYGINKEFAEKAILIVFNELEQGKSFEDTKDFKAPHYLDQHIRDTAIRLRDEWAKEESVKMETFFNDLLRVHKDKTIQEVLGQVNKPINWAQKVGKWMFRL